MYSVKLICDGNFTKASVVDKSIENVLKMFKKHFSRKSKPLSDDSDVEFHYEYQNLSHDELRILKKLVNSNRSVIHFKGIETSGGDCPSSSSDSDSDQDNKKGKRDTKAASSNKAACPAAAASDQDSDQNSDDDQPCCASATSSEPGAGGGETPEETNAKHVAEAVEIAKSLLSVLERIR